jgi:DNA-directed RNA polymerase specialized sigma subunit
MLNEMSRVLGSFDPGMQEIARLRFVEELSQADVALRLGITRRRVRTLEDRLLSGVRRHLARVGLGPEEK